MKLLKNKSIKRLLTIIIVGLVGYFFYSTLSSNWQEVKDIDFDLNVYSVIALLLLTVAVVESGRLWGKLLNVLTEREGKYVKGNEAVRVHIASWLLKYIPGQAGSLINKVAWAKGKGYSKKLVLITFVYENIFLLMASFLISVPILLIFNGSETEILFGNPLYIFGVVVAVGLLLLSLKGKTLHRVANLAFSKILKQPVGREFFLSDLQALKLQLFYTLPRLLNGVGFVFIAASFLEVSPSAYLPLGAAYIIAGAIGILAIFVPSGIGVREAVIVALTGQFIGLEQAIVLAIVARLYTTVADAALAAGYGLLTIRRHKEVS